jgi:hypothetical protein
MQNYFFEWKVFEKIYAIFALLKNCNYLLFYDQIIILFIDKHPHGWLCAGK